MGVNESTLAGGEQKNFCFVNSKGARKKLVMALFSVPRQALDLLPMYARLVAILDKVRLRRERACWESICLFFHFG